MLFIVLFEDNPEKTSMRLQHIKAHLEFLEKNSKNILGAGPLKEANVEGFSGGLWLVEAGSPEEVRQLYEADPFWPTGLRKSARVLQWSQVFANGKALI
jgi:uncharacterized protein YciI